MPPGEPDRGDAATPNRRSTHRHDVTLSAQVEVDGATHDVTIENVSLGGLQIRFDQRLSIGQRIGVVFSLPPESTSYEAFSIEVDAVVRWTKDTNAGLQFDGLRARDVWALNQFFAQVQGQAPPAE